MGYCGKVNGERESGLCWLKRGGLKREYRSWKIEVNTAVLSVMFIRHRVTESQSDRVTLLQTTKGTQNTGGQNFLCLNSINSPTRFARRGIKYSKFKKIAVLTIITFLILTFNITHYS